MIVTASGPFIPVFGMATILSSTFPLLEPFALTFSHLAYKVISLVGNLEKSNFLVKFLSSYQPANLYPSFFGVGGSIICPSSVKVISSTSDPPFESNEIFEFQFKLFRYIYIPDTGTFEGVDFKLDTTLLINSIVLIALLILSVVRI